MFERPTVSGNAHAPGTKIVDAYAGSVIEHQEAPLTPAFDHGKPFGLPATGNDRSPRIAASRLVSDKSERSRRGAAFALPIGAAAGARLLTEKAGSRLVCRTP